MCNHRIITKAVSGQVANGIFKQLIAAKQVASGTKADPAGAKRFRRVTSTLDVSKDTYSSNEISVNQQVCDMRHGMRKVEGSINGELSVGTYQGWTESVLRSASSPSVTTTLADIDVVSTTGAEGTLTTAAGDYLADGLKVGLVIRCTGMATGVENNDRNLMITELTATVMTVITLNNEPIIANAAGDTVVITSVGKHVYVPTANHTKDYWTIEHNFSDIVQSEQFLDCVFGQMDVKLPPTGMATVDFPVVGLSMDTSTTPYFTTPTPIVCGGSLASVNGVIFVGGVKVAHVTGLDFTVNSNAASLDAVVGSNTAPDITVGKLEVTGNLTYYFIDTVLRDMFLDETEFSLICAFTTDNTPTADFIAYSMSRCKLTGATKDDGEKGIVQSSGFQALLDTNGGVAKKNFATTITVQDSQFV